MAIASGCLASTPANIRWRCSSAAPIPAISQPRPKSARRSAMTRSTSMSAPRSTGGNAQRDAEGARDTLGRGVIAAGADALIVHARKAWLNGLSPKENRDIPPLDYDRVYRLKAAMPDVPVIINGGIGSLEEAKQHLAHVDSVMMGRAAYQEPWRLLEVDPEIFGEAAPHATMKAAFEA